MSGTIVAVTEGWEERDARNDRYGRYAILEIEVAQHIAGNAVGSRVFVAIGISQRADWGAVASDLPRGRVLLVLDDLADWQSGPKIGFPESSFVPFVDGIWFEDASRGMRGLWVQLDEVSPSFAADLTSFDLAISRLSAAWARR
ncbi:MAG TPA: hypothetical protein PKD27_00160 [Tepidiformaceae bacterium]|nr:hypothetical protein [Tepidiformaceae bacterium]